MGEHADELIDQGYAMEFEGSLDPEPKTCRRCGKTAYFVWQKTTRGWRLADGHGNIHECAKADRRDGKA